MEKWLEKKQSEAGARKEGQWGVITEEGDT